MVQDDVSKAHARRRIENVRISYYLLYFNPTSATTGGDVASLSEGFLRGFSGGFLREMSFVNFLFNFFFIVLLT